MRIGIYFVRFDIQYLENIDSGGRSLLGQTLFHFLMLAFRLRFLKRSVINAEL